MSTENTHENVEPNQESTEELSLEEKIQKMAEEDEVVAEAKPQEASEEPREEPKEPESSEESKEEVTSSYTPNLKYKVYDNEFEFDEKVVGFIKSKEDEEFFRDLYTKAAGIDVIKPKLEKYREEAASTRSSYDDLQGQYKQKETQLSYLNTLVTKGQYGDSASIDNLLDLLDIPDHVLGRVLAERLERLPEQIQAQRTNKEAEYRAASAQTQQRSYQEGLERLEYERASFELDKTLQTASEIKEIINFVDGNLGNGTFRKEVVSLGIELEDSALKNKEPLPDYQQVATLVADRYKKLMPQQTATVGQTPSAQPTPQGTVQKKVVVNTKNTIPNVGSGANESPTGRAIKSLDDIHRELNEHFGVNIE